MMVETAILQRCFCCERSQHFLDKTVVEMEGFRNKH